MPVNPNDTSTGEYKLQLKEYDGTPIFYAKDRQNKVDTVTCYLTRSSIDLPLERVLCTYIPVKYVRAAEGIKNLTTGDGKQRVKLAEPISTLFTGESKEVVLYLHIGTMFDGSSQVKEERRHIAAYREQLNRIRDKPEFWKGKTGLKAREIMNKIDKEYGKGGEPNLAVINQLFKEFNEVLELKNPLDLGVGLEEASLWGSIKGYIGLGMVVGFVGAIIYGSLNILYNYIFKSDSSITM